jgi:hypothetical protein
MIRLNPRDRHRARRRGPARPKRCPQEIHHRHRARHPAQLARMPPPRLAPALLAHPRPAHRVARRRVREPELVVEPLRATLAQEAALQARHEARAGHDARMRGRVRVVQPHGEDALGEEEEERVEDVLVDPDEEAVREVVVVVRVEDPVEPVDRGRGAAEERAWLKIGRS